MARRPKKPAETPAYQTARRNAARYSGMGSAGALERATRGGRATTPNERKARRSVNRLLNAETKRNFGTIGVRRMVAGDTG
jgi:hypothetical protein